MIGIYPVTHRDIDHIMNYGHSKAEAYKIAAADFLKDELKITKDDIDFNMIVKITRPKKRIVTVCIHNYTIHSSSILKTI